MKLGVRVTMLAGEETWFQRAQSVESDHDEMAKLAIEIMAASVSPALYQAAANVRNGIRSAGA